MLITLVYKEASLPASFPISRPHKHAMHHTNHGHTHMQTHTYVSIPTLIVQQSLSLLVAWSTNWNTPEVIVDHWIANEATSMLNAILL